MEKNDNGKWGIKHVPASSLPSPFFFFFFGGGGGGGG